MLTQRADSLSSGLYACVSSAGDPLASTPSVVPSYLENRRTIRLDEVAESDGYIDVAEVPEVCRTCGDLKKNRETLWSDLDLSEMTLELGKRVELRYPSCAPPRIAGCGRNSSRRALLYRGRCTRARKTATRFGGSSTKCGYM